MTTSSWLIGVCLLLFVLSVIGAVDVSYVTWDDLEVGSTVGLHSRNESVIVVDRNGKGDCSTVQAAVDLVPENNRERIKIHILPGVYSEKVVVPASKPYISFIGDPERPEATVVAWHDKASDMNMGTFKTASVTVEADYFCAVGITFENTVKFHPGAVGNQAVAFKISGENSVIFKSRFMGSQDTLLDESGTHYFLKCFIQGAIDFIFGNARSLYQDCTLSVVQPSYAIAAQRRDSAGDNGVFAFVNCTVRGAGSVFLGRAWGDYSRVIYAHSELDMDIKPQGWSDWGVASREKTAFIGEYMCTGRGADRRGRVAWSKALTPQEAQPYLDTKLINGNQWLRL